MDGFLITELMDVVTERIIRVVLRRDVVIPLLLQDLRIGFKEAFQIPVDLVDEVQVPGRTAFRQKTPVGCWIAGKVAEQVVHRTGLAGKQLHEFVGLDIVLHQGSPFF